VLPVTYPKFASMVEQGDSIYIGRYLVSGADTASLYLTVRACGSRTGSWRAPGWLHRALPGVGASPWESGGQPAGSQQALAGRLPWRRPGGSWGSGGVALPSPPTPHPVPAASQVTSVDNGTDVVCTARNDAVLDGLLTVFHVERSSDELLNLQVGRQLPGSWRAAGVCPYPPATSQRPAAWPGWPALCLPGRSAAVGPAACRSLPPPVV